MATQNKKYLDDQGLSTVAAYINERLKTVTTMPASAGDGTVLLYTGTTSGSYVNGHMYQYSTSSSSWVDITMSSSVSILPQPSSSVTESDIVTAINAALPASTNVPSLYSIQNWSNTMTIRVEYTGALAVGATGIGTWQDSFNNPTAADEAGWGWWYDDMFKLSGLASADNIKIDVLYDPDSANGDVVINGGYQLDTDNGYLCLKFGKPLTVSTHRIFVDFTITRNFY